MTTTPRLGLTHVEGTDTLAGSSPTTALQGKMNAALNAFDASVGRIICTSATRPTTNLFPGIQAYETDTKQNIINPSGVAGAANWRVESPGAAGAGAVRSYRPIRPYSGDTSHSAFPGVVVLPNNKALMVWRVGSTHTSIDGAIRGATSTDMGKTWSTSFLLWNGVSGVDFRDPQVSLSRDGTKIYITYFKAVSGNPGAGVFFRYSTDEGVTWSGEVRIEVHYLAACSAPCVELDNGTLVIPFYGRQVLAESWESCYTAKSINGGTSWQSAVKIVDGVAAGDHRQEPYITMKGQTGVMTYRHGNNSQIGVSTTSDNTVNWSGGVAKFAGTGRPATCWVNDGALACVYRSTANGDALIRSSRDNGSTWSPPRLVEPAWNSGGWMTYASMAKVSPDAALMVMGNEAATNQSRLFISYAGEAGAVTPFGALPSQQDMVWGNEDNKIFATNFEQTNGGLVYPWYVLAGAVTVTDGEVQSASADNVVDLIAVHTGTNDMEIEAEINCGGTGTIQSGAGIIFRMVSANTYLIFTIEGQGVNYRMYKVVSGVSTLLERNGDSPGAPFDYNVGVRTLPFNQYVKYKIICRERYIWVYVNDQWIVASSGAGQVFPSALLSAADYSTFSGGKFAGVKLNAQSTTTHKCRRFSVKG
jgi:hypothetical protein